MNFFKKKNTYVFTVTLNLSGFKDTCEISFKETSEDKALILANNLLIKWTEQGCSLDKGSKFIYIPTFFIKSLELEKKPKII